MSRNLTIIATAALSASIVTGASAGLNQIFECGPLFFDQHSIAYGDDQIITRNLQMEPNPSVIVGLRFRIQYDEVDASGNPFPDPISWASDLGLVINFDNTVKVGFGGSARNLGAIAGGYSQAATENEVDMYDIWSFDGIVSDSPGFYFHEFMFTDPEFIVKPEFLEVLFTDTWNGNTLFNSLTIEFIKVPTPGVASLLGLGVLTVIRRRR